MSYFPVLLLLPCRGLVDCYVTQSRHREAASAAATACQQLNSSARALTLYASVVAKDPYQVRASGRQILALYSVILGKSFILILGKSFIPSPTIIWVKSHINTLHQFSDTDSYISTITSRGGTSSNQIHFSFV